ncbi:hypothetical protein [Acidovorax sp. RAC01]|uniref:hypothetical protein n=1 Tax=Acidovorax sp. RAC01 TaxID=1842533 RepID=UPI00083E7814|nr:hypothetical protein [Acidovorax sp. RAC01]AOG24345.1 hypothetical protein BSY15_1082 [Acidovorax sp. RAC01]
MKIAIRFATHALAAAAFLAPFAAVAQTADASTAQQRFAQERQKCMTHNTQDSQATCLREAGASLDASRKGQLTSAAGSEAATQRCAVFKDAAEQAECVRRVQSAPASGSVPGGGVLRESTTTVTVPQ